jgi:hypothetical protein
MTALEILKKLEGRTLVSVQPQEISGDVYHLILKCDDELTVVIEAHSEKCYACDLEADNYFNITEVE